MDSERRKREGGSGEGQKSGVGGEVGRGEKIELTLAVSEGSYLHFVHRRAVTLSNQFQVIRRIIRRLTSGRLSAAADSKTSPRNPVNVY